MPDDLHIHPGNRSEDEGKCVRRDERHGKLAPFGALSLRSGLVRQYHQRSRISRSSLRSLSQYHAAYA